MDKNASKPWRLHSIKFSPDFAFAHHDSQMSSDHAIATSVPCSCKDIVEQRHVLVGLAHESSPTCPREPKRDDPAQANARNSIYRKTIRSSVFYTLKRVAGFLLRCFILGDEAPESCPYEATAGPQSAPVAAAKGVVSTRSGQRSARATGAGQRAGGGTCQSDIGITRQNRDRLERSDR